MKFTGERVVIDDMKSRPDVLQEHIARYNFALLYVANKKVLDAACGTGYGVDLMSKIAREVDGCDVDIETVSFAKDKYPNFFFADDLNNPQWAMDYDVITSFETIEHLEYPETFLEWASEHCDTFIFSIPVNMPSEFHKHSWTISQIKEMILKYFPKVEFFSQIRLNFYLLNDDATYVVGIAEN